MDSLNIKNQDLLETIFEMEQLHGKARLTDVAAKRGFSKSRANQEIKKLVELGLVKEEKYGPLVLTTLGVFEARRVVYTHLLIKTYLMECLHISEEVAENDACAIEHVISEETIIAMLNALKKITDKLLTLPSGSLEEAEEYLIHKKRLNELKLGEKATVVSIEGGASLKKRLGDNGIFLHETLQVVGVPEAGDPLEFQIKNHRVSLFKKDVETVIVKTQ